MATYWNCLIVAFPTVRIDANRQRKIPFKIPDNAKLNRAPEVCGLNLLISDDDKAATPLSISSLRIFRSGF
jgi:hypothetical protein